MSRKYQVLWVDDEWDKMIPFKNECEKIHDIVLVPYKTSADGIAALDREFDRWDAVLLDAKMLDESEEEVASVVGLRKIIAKLDSFKSRRVIPRFISTGQPDLMSNDFFEESFGKFYKKDVEDDALIYDMLAAIKISSRGQIESLYSDVFASMKKLGMPDDANFILTDILLAMHFPNEKPDFKPKDCYNNLRQFLEYIFRSCHSFGLLPDAFIVKDQVNLNQSSLYLAGEDAENIGYRYGEKGEGIFEKYIAKIVQSVLVFGNIRSHTVKISEEDNRNLDLLFRSKNSRFIVFGFALQLCEVVVWLDQYTQQRDLAICRAKCTKLVPKERNKYEGCEGVPEKDDDLNVWHLGPCLLKMSYFKEGDKIRLRDVTDNTSPSRTRYPYFAYYDMLTNSSDIPLGE
jgi:hypothetical protein